MVPKFIMMVGLPASGKSTYALELADTYNANIHASDSISEELSGDINNQDINDIVFKTLHNRIKKDLSIITNFIKRCNVFSRVLFCSKSQLNCQSSILNFSNNTNPFYFLNSFYCNWFFYYAMIFKSMV